MAKAPSSTDQRQLHGLFALGEEISYAKRQFIVQPDDSVYYTYYVKQGIVKIYSLNNQGEEYIHIFYGQGEIFPLQWALNHSRVRRSVVIQAVTDCVLYRLPAERLMKAIQTSAPLAFAIVQQITKQFNIYASRIDNLEYKYASERLAYRLLFLAGRFGEKVASGFLLPPLTQQDIASSINLSRESANREIERLVRKGYVGRNGRRLIVCDMDNLRKELHSDVNPADWQIHV